MGDPFLRVAHFYLAACLINATPFNMLRKNKIWERPHLYNWIYPSLHSKQLPRFGFISVNNLCCFVHPLMIFVNGVI